MDSLPESISDDMMSNKEFMDALRMVLLGVHVVKGVLVCPTTGRQFPIVNGIPNLTVTEADCRGEYSDNPPPTPLTAMRRTRAICSIDPSRNHHVLRLLLSCA